MSRSKQPAMTPRHSLTTLMLFVASLFTLTLVAVKAGFFRTQTSFDSALVEAAPVIDWNLLITGTGERRERERDERLGAGPVRIAGYLVPLDELSFDRDPTRQTEFLLVPYSGACLHYPPPPSDQMIHVQMTPGRAASLDLWSWDPLEVAGVLRAETLESVYGEIGYRMDGIAVREYRNRWEAL